MRRHSRQAATAWAVALVFIMGGLGAVGITPAAAASYAPLDRPGPELSVPADALASSLTCSPDYGDNAREPVLFVPGTFLDPKANFSWNYLRAFTTAGRPWCAVTIPANGTGDIQVAGEFIVHAIRTMHAESDRPIQIVGHSQGGMLPRWALRFWPDTRAMVDDVVGLAPANHGSDMSNVVCALSVCWPSIWQMRSGSSFEEALNSYAETFEGISYTNVYTRTDWVVHHNLSPEAGASLSTGDGEIKNIAIQSICPLDLSEHLLVGTTDAVAYALTLDALDHEGPADPKRIAKRVCLHLAQPGVDPKTLARDLAAFTVRIGGSAASGTMVNAEPALAAYATD